MQTIDIMQEIQRLPLTKKFDVIEQTLKAIKQEEIKHQLQTAADALYNDYATNKELTAFTALDFENFYETK